jgi:hypothetical protein
MKQMIDSSTINSQIPPISTDECKTSLAGIRRRLKICSNLHQVGDSSHSHHQQRCGGRVVGENVPAAGLRATVGGQPLNPAAAASTAVSLGRGDNSNQQGEARNDGPLPNAPVLLGPTTAAHNKIS